MTGSGNSICGACSGSGAEVCSTPVLRRSMVGQIFALEAGGDHGDLHFVAHRFIEHDAEVDLHIFVGGGVADQGAGFVHFMQAEPAAIP